MLYQAPLASVLANTFKNWQNSLENVDIVLHQSNIGLTKEDENIPWRLNNCYSSPPMPRAPVDT